VNTQLLVVDPQNDFCDVPGAALPVPGASADLDRLAAFIGRCGAAFAAIHVTQDAHHPLDIAHPGWWQDAGGASPSPFTVISPADVLTGRWQPRDASLVGVALAYVEALAARGRYQLVIWPEHCLLGSWGMSIQPTLFAALNAWSRQGLRQVQYHLKGMNPHSEHYSALEAEVPDPADPHTRPDPAFLAELAAADRLLIAGEALSHCVAGTVRDLARVLGAEYARKMILLTDCTSPVPGFEARGETFLAEMRELGVSLARSTEVLPA
jgi:nicotinamidase/pyrazinamidase